MLDLLLIWQRVAAGCIIIIMKSIYLTFSAMRLAFDAGMGSEKVSLCVLESVNAMYAYLILQGPCLLKVWFDGFMR